MTEIRPQTPHSGKENPAGEKPRPPARNYYSPEALHAVALSVTEARRLNHDYVGAEHMLLALVQLEGGIAATTLRRLGLRLEAVRLEVERQSLVVTSDGVSPIPYIPRAKGVIQIAREEADALGHPSVTPEHLLLGLLKEPGGMAAQVLMEAEIDIEATRREILGKIAPAGAAAGP